MNATTISALSSATKPDSWGPEVQPLAAGALIRVTQPERPLLIRCVEGRLWVTREGDPGDHLIAAGEEHRSLGGGLLLIQALHPSRFVVAEAA